MKHEGGMGSLSGTDPPYPPLLSAGQLLATHTAALLGLPTINSALYHRALLAWPPCPPSPSPPLHKLNNNHIVAGTPLDGDTEKKPRKRKQIGKREPSAKLSPPAPPSPPSSAGSPPAVAAAAREPPRDKVFTCKVCSRSFGYKHVLQNHERTHTGEKPFECGECHKRFTRDHHLKTHLRLHTGEKPYSCPHCPRHFVQVANLRRHLRVHTGERPYRCALCQARFSDSNQLKAHALLHNGERPFSCVRCHGSFRRRHHLLHHRCPSSSLPSLLGHSPPLPPSPSSPPSPYSCSDSSEGLPCPLLPEQTEPEDLSLGKRYIS